MMGSERLYGVYLGEVTYVRYKRGAVFIQAKIYSLSKTDKDHNEHPWFTPLAPVVMPAAGAVQDGGRNTYGTLFSPQIGDNCLIVFEAGHQGVPYCIGYTPHADDVPVEFDNDDYLNKEREWESREKPLSSASEAMQQAQASAAQEATSSGLSEIAQQEVDKAIAENKTEESPSDQAKTAVNNELGENATGLIGQGVDAVFGEGTMDAAMDVIDQVFEDPIGTIGGLIGSLFGGGE